MKVFVLLMCVCWLCWRTEADSRAYLITAPLSLRLDAVETVLLQLFDFTQPETVHLYLKTSMAPNHVLLSQQVVTLNAQNHYQAMATVRLHTGQLDKSVNQVILHVQSQKINHHVPIAISRVNGFLFIQTDKPLYTPHQNVRVRAFSLNQELRPANRSVLLTFRDPDHTIVDTVEMLDINNGIPSMQNPFKIPIKPKLGLWTIEAAYSGDFTTAARTDFEVKEYVLPSFTIHVEPEATFITQATFDIFNFKVSARYLHGAPVAEGEVFLRYGYVSGKNPPVLIPSSVSRDRLSSTGEVELTVNMSRVLSKHDGPKSFNDLIGKYLYIAVLLQEDTGGISQEAEFASVKFIRSPYSLSLVSTPPFIKPGLPYNIQVLVKDHLDKPVSRVKIRLAERTLTNRAGASENLLCDDSAISQSSGLAVLVCNPSSEAKSLTLRFETDDPNIPASSQASLSLEAVAYSSPNHRYLYIDPPMPGNSLQVGHFASIQVYTIMPAYVPVKGLSYLVLSKGKVVHFDTKTFLRTGDKKQYLSFEVTAAMVPSIRLLVYYIVHGEGTSELVADSVWLDVKDKCINGLQTHLSYRKQIYKPQEKLQLDIQANQRGLVALSAVDSALFTLRPTYKDPISMVMRHIEQSDQGCGGGGGRDSADVFRLAGLTFITNANAHPRASTEACTAAVRPKRALSEEEKEKKVQSHGRWKMCCEHGMKHIPKTMSCSEFAEQFKLKRAECKEAFRDCCEFVQRHLDQDHNLILGRNEMGADFDEVPSLVRSYFPESWMWEVQPISSGKLLLQRKLPDSLTTWEVKAVGMFENGICVAEPLQVSVNLPLSVDVPLPYQVVRGEQLELKGSVYNQQLDSIKYCVTLTVGPALCLMDSHPAERGRRSTTCSWTTLRAKAVGQVTFTVLGLEPGEHTLTFSLKTRSGQRDTLEKKLRVVPEGLRKEVFSGGTLDPQGIYGAQKRVVELKNALLLNMVPNTKVERMVTISGEVIGDILSVMHSPEGLRELVNLPFGSAEAELGGVQPLIQVYHYLETTRSWDVLGADIRKSSQELRQKIKEGLVSMSSFKLGDASYSMWRKRESSTWVTAMVVKMLSSADPVVSVDHQSLSESVAWLIRSTQQPDGRFIEKSSFRPNKAATDAVSQAVHLTSFVLIVLHQATRIRDPILQLQFHEDSLRSAANYISQHALAVKSVYVRAVATYALTLYDSNSMAASELLSSLERESRQKGHPAVLRYWQEPGVSADWVKPDESSSLTVETTAYVLLTMLLKGRISDANPILSWLTQDQHYGEGFYTVQDTVVTLEALTAYGRVVPRAILNQDINVRYKTTQELGRVQITQTRPVATPIQVAKSYDITVSTGFGSGVSTVKMKTVYYETAASSKACNFELSVEVSRPPAMNSPRLVACAKYTPPPNEVSTESTLTVMKIQLPTGVIPVVEDLKQFRDAMEPIISDYKQEGDTVIIQVDAIPSTSFLCVAFRIRTGFTVRGVTESLFSVYEPQDKGSMCTKSFTYEDQKLQRLCVGNQCQCMTAACATYRGNIDVTLTAAKRTDETCQPNIKYAYKVKVKSSAVEGDFETFTATVVEVLKNSDKAFEAVTSGTEVDLMKKITCSSIVIQSNNQYLVMGASGSEVTVNESFRYRLPLDSEALVEVWPTDCISPECLDYISQLEDYALDLQISSCPDSA